MSSYDGPTRTELLHQIQQYNHQRHQHHQPLIYIDSIPADHEALEALQRREQNPSASVRQLTESIHELWALRRYQLSKSQASSRNDWARIHTVAQSLVKAAEGGMARADAKAAVEGQGATIVPGRAAGVRSPERGGDGSGLAAMKTPERPREKSQRLEPREALRSPQAAKQHGVRIQSPESSARHHQHGSGQKLQPILKAGYKIPQRPESSKRHGHVQEIRGPEEASLQPQAIVKLYESRPTSPEDKARLRGAVIQQAAILAQVQADRLHSEVRRF